MTCLILNANPIAEKSEIDHSSTEKSKVSLANFSDNSRVMLQTLRVKLFNGKSEYIVRVIIDTGSQNSYVLLKKAKDLNYASRY